MLRTTTLSAAALLGLTLLAPSSAQAVGETCQGLPATIVGTPGQPLTGTEGPDVVVTNGASRTRTLGGDDVICITGTTNPYVDAAEGADVVVSTLGPDAFSTVKLGPGSDRFTGSASSDVVYAGGKRSRVLDDLDRDVIDSGPPNPEYGNYVVSGQPGQPNPDQVRVPGGEPGDGGSASTLELHGVPDADGSFDGSGGSELVLETAGARRVSVDTIAGTWGTEAGTTAISGFADFTLADREGPRRLTFRGSARDESLDADLGSDPRYDVRLGGGDDRVVLRGDRLARRGTVLAGGGGRDSIGVVMVGRDVDLDLGRGRLLAGKPGQRTKVRASGFEDAEIVARRIDVRGTRGDNDIRAWGCNATVRALAGDDVVSPLTLVSSAYFECRDERTRFEGGPGDDRLSGDAGRDVLIGGPGRDVANGRSGRDTCSAEKMRRCEVRR